MGNSSSTHTRRRRETTTSTGVRGSVSRAPRRASQMIPDQFTTLNQVTAALRMNGLESCNLILGIDFTKSNEWSGKRTFGGRSLHTIDDPLVSNPYENVIESIGLTLRDFDEDNCIPVYGFGDEFTADNSVFTFSKDESQVGFPFEGIRSRYREIVPNVVTAGPTSFAPIINQAVSIVNRTGQYHILVIIADGQVTRSADVPAHAVSKNEKETIDAITYASNFPLSIIMVGVGDGPWQSMLYFDNHLTHRQFDNFQFVEFHKIVSQTNSHQQITQFALHALMEIPEQYQAVKQLGYLNKGPYQFASNLPQTMVFPAPQNHQTVSCESNLWNNPAPTASNLPAFSQSLPYPTGNHASPPQPNYMPHRISTGSRASFSQSLPYPVSVDTNNVQNASYVIASVETSVPSAPSYSREELPPTIPIARPPMPSRQPSHAELELSQLQDSLLCCICEDRKKDTVFQCGHETCQSCSIQISQCPTCRQDIQVRIKRYGV